MHNHFMVVPRKFISINTYTQSTLGFNHAAYVINTHTCEFYMEFLSLCSWQQSIYSCHQGWYELTHVSQYVC